MFLLFAMKKIITGFEVLLVILFLGSLVSCEDDDEGYIALSDKLYVKAQQSGKIVDINWTLTNIRNFKNYRVCRSLNKDDYNNSYFGSNSPNYVLTSIEDKYASNYIDKNASYLGLNYYWIEALYTYEYEDGHTATRIMKSNLDSCKVSDTRSFNKIPNHVIFNKEENLLGLCFTDQFVMFNYDLDKIIKSIEYSSYSPNHSYPCFGQYKDNLELYLQGDDGGLKVYDANNMSLITQYPVFFNSGNPSASISTNNQGIIYFKEWYNNYLYIIDRETSNISTYSNSNYYGSFLAYEDFNNLLIAFEIDSYPVCYCYTLNSQGLVTSYVSRSVSGYYYPCVKINSYDNKMYILPETKEIDITNFSNGYSSSSLGNLQDITFDVDEIYTAPFGSKTIERIRSNGSTTSYEVPGYPIYVFVDDSQLIVLFVEEPTTISSVSSSSRRYFKGYIENTPFGIIKIEL